MTYKQAQEIGANVRKGEARLACRLRQQHQQDRD
jgi:antirestriction protein ArdC